MSASVMSRMSQWCVYEWTCRGWLKHQEWYMMNVFCMS